MRGRVCHKGKGRGIGFDHPKAAQSAKIGFTLVNPCRLLSIYNFRPEHGRARLSVSKTWFTLEQVCASH